MIDISYTPVVQSREDQVTLQIDPACAFTTENVKLDTSITVIEGQVIFVSFLFI